MCEESLSFFILLSSNHPDPETEDIVDIYSAAITDKLSIGMERMEERSQ